MVFDAATPNGAFCKHDVDTTIHTLFSRQLSANIFESMGVIHLGVIGVVFRIGILPIKQSIGGLHYQEYQQQKQSVLTILFKLIPRLRISSLVIESKNNARDLEDKIGLRLIEYIKALFKIAPTAYKEDKSDWKLFGGKKSPLSNPTSFSGGAFCYKSLDEMKASMKKGKLDFIFACEFKSDGTPTVGHILLSDKNQFLRNILTDIGAQFSSGIEN